MRDAAQERLQVHLKKENIKITFNGMMLQDFETKDGVLKKRAKRIGGGFTSGRTVHEVLENDISISNRETLPVDNLAKIYNYFSDYCDKTFK